MHVVIIASANHPLREPFAGGLESLTWLLTRGLRRRGVEVTLFAGPGSDPTLETRELRVQPLELTDQARSDVSMPPERWLAEHHAYLQVMLELQHRTDVDVIHNNSLHHLPLALAATARAPMLTTLHTPPTPWLEPAIRLMDQSRARFVAVSEHTAQLWRHVAPAQVVLNGVDVDRWVAGPGGDDLVWFGRLAAAAGWRIRLAGPSPNRAYFEAALRPLLGSRAEYVGHLGVDDLVALVGSSAAALVTPAWDEPYGLVAAESLACGTPVLAYRRGGLPEFVPQGCGVFVPGGDIAAATAAVDVVAALDRQDCRAHAVQHCSADRMIENYLQAYAATALLEPAA
jgi:glycosyltransferase involved in cell wall biosynthesis